jgi:hypothetical protein
MMIKDLSSASRKAAIALLGVSESHFHRLTRAGVFSAKERGSYDLKQVVGSWVQYHLDGKSAGDHATEKRLLTVAQRKKLELDMEERRRELVPLAEAQEAFNEAMVIVSSQLDGLPGRGAMELAGMNDPALVRAWLFEETRRIRDAAANRLEEFFSGPARGRNTETPAPEDGGSMGEPVPDTPKRKRGARTVEE